jgi:5'-nucleotidase
MTYLHRSILAALLLAGLTVGCSQPSPQSDEAATETAQADRDLVPFHLVGFNDFHGHLESPAGDVKVDGETIEAGGAAQLAAHVRQFRREHDNTATVLAGDLIGASPLISALFHDEPSVEVMNELGLTAMPVGNHEFDEGWKELLRIAEGGCHPEDGCREGQDKWEGASFPFLAANVEKPDGELLFDPYVVREYDGVKVGFLGLTLDGLPSIVVPSAVEGLEFRNEWKTINEYVPKLRKKGVETIVVLIHEGGVPSEKPESLNDCPGLEGPIVEIAEKSSDAVDAFVSGHTHKTYNCRIDDKLVTSADSHGLLVTEYDFALDPASGDVVEMSAQNIPIRADGPADKKIASMVEEYEKLAADEAERPVGTIGETLPREPDSSGEMPLGEVIADAQLAATASEAKGGADLALMNPGGVRGALQHEGEGETTQITYGQLHTIQPFGNQLVVMTLTGQQLHDLLEQQWRGDAQPTVLQVSEGFTYRWDASSEAGNRVDPKEIRLDGEPIDLEAEYRVTVNNFLAEGGDGFTILEKGKDRTWGQIDVEALADYFEANSPVAAPSESRIQRTSDEGQN